jgi:hypothetical protein
MLIKTSQTNRLTNTELAVIFNKLIYLERRKYDNISNYISSNIDIFLDQL